MIAAKNEAPARSATNCRQSPPISLDTSGLGIMEAATVHCTPEIGVELEIGAAPLVAHGAEYFFQVLLHFRMRPIQRVPRSMSPSAKGDLAGRQRLIVGAANKPFRMLLENMGILLRDERSYPDGRLKPAPASRWW